MPNDLVKLDGARMALAEVSTAAQAKKIADIAKSAEIFALKQGSEQAAAYAHEIHCDALRLMGEYLAREDKNKGAVPGKTGNKGLPVLDPTPTLAEQGITKRESVQAQAVADVAKSDPQSFEGFRIGKIPLKRIVQQSKRKSQKKRAHAAAAGEGEFVTSLETFTGRKFGCIYADPPWRYQNQGTRASTDNHYSTMTVDEICALPIKDLAAEQSHLHLWTTNAFLFECPKIFDAWGFDFKSSFIWVKTQMGIGNYWRNSHEILLLAVRGKLVGQDKSLMSWIECGRGAHSSKPDVIRSMIEKISPGPRLELFGRRRVHGWAVFGNEIVDML